jgi:hypothetical protein
MSYLERSKSLVAFIFFFRSKKEQLDHLIVSTQDFNWCIGTNIKLSILWVANI